MKLLLPRLCTRPQPNPAVRQDLSLFQPPSFKVTDAQIFTWYDSCTSSTTIKANGIKYRKIVLLRTKFVLNQWSTVINAKASMLYIFHLCTAPWQFVKSLWKSLARTLPTLEDLCRLLFRFFMFPQRLTPFAGTNKCTADCTKLLHSLETF